MATNFLHELIVSRCSALGLSKYELVQMAGYINHAKGLRRLDQIQNFDFESPKHIIDKLPSLLEIGRLEVAAAIQETRASVRAENEQEWRDTFKPYAKIRTGKNGCPRQITMAALCNVGRFVYTYFDNDVPEADYIGIAVKAYRANEEEIRSFFFEPQDIVINYTPDRATRFTLEGEFIEYLAEAIKPASISVLFR